MRRSGSRWASPAPVSARIAGGTLLAGQAVGRLASSRRPGTRPTWNRSSTAWRCSSANSKESGWALRRGRRRRGPARRGRGYRSSVHTPPLPSRRPTGGPGAVIIAYAHQGGAWEAPSLDDLRHRPAALAARARRPVGFDVHATADGRSGGVPRRDGGSHHRRRRANICADPRRAGQRSTTRTGGPPGADVSPGLDPRPSTRCAGPRARAPRFGIATLAEVLERYPGVPVFNLDIKRTAPEVEFPTSSSWPTSCAASGGTDDVIVASFSDPAIRRVPRDRALEFATSLATLETAEFYRARREPTAPFSANGRSRCRCRRASGRSWLVDDQFVRRAPRRGSRGARLDDQRRPSEMRRLVALDVDGITDRSAWSGCIDAGLCLSATLSPADRRLPGSGRTGAA